jgi:hypothetical protein
LSPPTPAFPSSGSGIGALFSRNRDGTGFGAEDEEEKGETENSRNIETNENKRGIVSCGDKFWYGVRCVDDNFLRLTWRVYSQTFLWMAPVVTLLFLVLPAWSSSSSPFLQLLATKTWGGLLKTAEVLAKTSQAYFGRPMALIFKWLVGSTFSRRNLLLWGILGGPIFEELFFRLAFRGCWKAMFRPINISSFNNNSSDGTNSSNKNKEIDEPNRGPMNSLFAPSLPSFTKILPSVFRPAPRHKKTTPKPRYSNRSWRIASGICFGIAHFSNYFPLDKYTFDGVILLPTGTAKERFLLSLFPKDFCSQPANGEFCLVSMALTGAMYQAMHCFFNTLVLYGPLLDDSKRGGILAAIGAHIAWNANVIWLGFNLQLRLLYKILQKASEPRKVEGSPGDDKET